MSDAGRTPRLAGFSSSRDLGGWPTVPGARTRFDSVIRSNTPAELSRTDLASGVGFTPGPRSTAPASAAQPINQMIDRVGEHFGGPQAYLAWLGLTTDHIDTLTHRLV